MIKIFHIVKFNPAIELCNDFIQNGGYCLKDSRDRNKRPGFMSNPWPSIWGVGSCGKEGSSLPAWHLPFSLPDPDPSALGVSRAASISWPGRDSHVIHGRLVSVGSGHEDVCVCTGTQVPAWRCQWECLFQSTINDMSTGSVPSHGLLHIFLMLKSLAVYVQF